MALAGLAAAGGSTVNIIINAIDNFSRVFRKANLTLAKFRTAGLIAGAVGAVIAGGMLMVVKSAAKVETGFAKVNTLLDEGQDAQKLYGKFVEETNVLMGNQGDQLSALDGLYQIISAGITDTAEAQEFMNKATISSVGGSAELSTVILAGTKIMAAFGIEIKDTEMVMDKLAGTVVGGQLTLEELGPAISKVSGLAAELGLSLDETLGITAGLTKVLKDSDAATTGLQAVLSGILKPTDALKEVVKELGFESAVAMVKEKGLMTTLNMLKDAVGGDVEAMGELFGNVRAIRAIFPALGSASEEVAESIDIVTNSAGLSQKQYEDMAKTIEFKWGVAMSEAGNVMIDVGNIIKEGLLPVLEILTKGIKIMAEWWNKMSPAMKTSVVVFGAMTAAVLLLAGAIALVTFIASPWLGIIIGIGIAVAALTAGVVWLWKSWEKLGIVTKILIGIFLPFIAIPLLIAKNWDKVGATFLWLKDKVIKPLWDLMKDFAEWLTSSFLGRMNTILNILSKTTSFVGKIGSMGSRGIVTSGVLGSMATGGPILKTGPYMLHKGENVIPSGSAKGTGTVINIENIYGTDPDEMAEALQDKLDTMIST